MLKKSPCLEALQGHATHRSELQGGLEDQKRARSKNFWLDLGNVLVPRLGHSSKTFIHAQSLLKSSDQFPLDRNLRSPKPPPWAQEGIFHLRVSLGDVKTVTKKMTQAQEYIHRKKSTIFVL